MKDGHCGCCAAAESKACGRVEKGGRLVLRAAAAFLLPLFSAVVGVALSGEGVNRQVLGAVAGLVMGCGLAVGVSRTLRVKESE
jgi:hypothetical protein